MDKLQKSIEYARADFDKNHEVRAQVWSFGWYGNSLIAISKNSIKSHPLNLKNPRFKTGTKGSCAEMGLTLKLRAKTNIPFKKIVMVSVRLDKQLRVKNSKPCISCQNLLRFCEFKKVYHTNDVGGFEEY